MCYNVVKSRKTGVQKVEYVVWQLLKPYKPVLIGGYETLCEAVKVVEQCKQVYEKYRSEKPVWEIRDLRGNKIL